MHDILNESKGRVGILTLAVLCNCGLLIGAWIFHRQGDTPGRLLYDAFASLVPLEVALWAAYISYPPHRVRISCFCDPTDPPHDNHKCTHLDFEAVLSGPRSNETRLHFQDIWVEAPEDCLAWDLLDERNQVIHVNTLKLPGKFSLRLRPLADIKQSMSLDAQICVKYALMWPWDKAFTEATTSLITRITFHPEKSDD